MRAVNELASLPSDDLHDISFFQKSRKMSNCVVSCRRDWRFNHLDVEERAGCFAWFVILVSRDCCVALPRCAMDLSAVCDCGIS